MDSAFSDLDGLMSKAKEMVRSGLHSIGTNTCEKRMFAQVELANRVAQIKQSDDGDADSFGAMMASAGIDNPVTRCVNCSPPPSRCSRSETKPMSW